VCVEGCAEGVVGMRGMPGGIKVGKEMRGSSRGDGRLVGSVCCRVRDCTRRGRKKIRSPWWFGGRGVMK
jgi:hypothetical protein